MTSAAAAATPARPNPGQGLAFAPILQSSHARIRELGARRATSLSHVQSAVEGDAAVALNLFADVNARLKRAGRDPVGDIPRAILFMGMAELPGRITQAAIVEDVAAPALCTDLTRILRRAHHASRQAQAIGGLIGGISGDELLAASLAREGLPFIELLAQQPGSTLNLNAFNNFLPAAPDSHDANRLSRTCLDLAARFATATEESWDESELDPLYQEISEATGRDAGDVAKRLRRATVEAARTGSHFGTYPAALHLMSPGARKPAAESPPPRPKVANKPKQAVADKPAGTAPAAASAEPKPQAPAPKVTPQESATAATTPERKVTASIDAIAGAAAGGATAAAILPLALEAICEHAGMKLAFLLMRDKANADLRLRASRGLEIPAKYRETPCVVDENALLGKLMAKPAAFQWQPEKHARALSGLPLKLMGAKPGFFYSIHVDKKPLGILVGCRPSGATADLAEAFAAFRKIGTATRDALEHTRTAASR